MTPGPQQKLWSFDVTLVSLSLLAVVLLLLIIYSIVQANAAMLTPAYARLLSLKLLDTATAASLLVTVIGALLVRHQFAVSGLPRINYKSMRTERHDRQGQGETFETWRVEIRNTGLGPAIINRTGYVWSRSCPDKGADYDTFAQLTSKLAAVDLVPHRDYWMENIASGFAITSKETCFVFEITTEHLEKMERLSMVLYFQSQLGDRYRRAINLLPEWNVGQGTLPLKR